LSLCQLNLLKYDECINTCTEILEKEPTHVKALYRTSQALFAQGEAAGNDVSCKLSREISLFEKSLNFAMRAKAAAPNDTTLSAFYDKVHQAMLAAKPQGDIDDLD
jgi:hypothetical protein